MASYVEVQNMFIRNFVQRWCTKAWMAVFNLTMNFNFATLDRHFAMDFNTVTHFYFGANLISVEAYFT